MPNVRSQYIFIPLYETANLLLGGLGGGWRYFYGLARISSSKKRDAFGLPKTG
jgi:hypothetical protein